MVQYTLIHSSRKTLALQITENGEFIVRAPKYLSIKIIEEHIRKKQTWIDQSLEKIKKRQREKIYYSQTEKDSMKILLKSYIEKQVEFTWRKHNLPKYTTIKITASEKRWGSCSGKNGLCFSYRLAEYIGKNELFINAIIIHELAHLREKNHQKPFWNLVYSMMPNYENVIQNTLSKKL